MGNVAIWKPASSAVLPCYFLMKLLEEAGLPNGVINFLPFWTVVGDPILNDPNLAGVHFTGSTKPFSMLENHRPTLKIIKSRFREIGGKDFAWLMKVQILTN